MRKTIFFFSLLATSAAIVPASHAAFDNDTCWKYHAHCVKGCSERSIGRDVCYRKCDSGVMDCTKRHPPASTHAPPERPHGKPIGPHGIPGPLRPGGGVNNASPYGIPAHRPPVLTPGNGGTKTGTGTGSGTILLHRR